MVRVQIGESAGKKLFFELNKLTRHAAVLGTTGSGKTVMCKVLAEECLARGIPVIAIDPKGDIGGLGIVDKDFDFRPFLPQKKAETTAQLYAEKTFGDTAQNLTRTKTTIYTPQSDVGVRLSLMPSLSAPRENHDELAEAAADSVLSLTGMRGLREKFQSFLSALIITAWNEKKDLSIADLIQLVRKPPIAEVGSLAIDDFISEKERQRLAAALNVLLTSPAKRAWAQGVELDVRGMLARNCLNIVDLRHVQEKQFAIEQVLLGLYKELLTKGGSQRLRYILYIDELAGILPPPPANPPVKRLLELLIRQSRAFGLGIILATQSPGDVDYKLLGNVGTRFIGKLRTANDIEKAALASNFSAAQLRAEISDLTTGEFILTDAVANKTKRFTARWLYSYHGGPLTPKEIHWVNNPKSRERTGTLGTKKIVVRQRPRKGSTISTKRLLVQAERATKSTRRPKTQNLSRQVLGKLTKEVKKYADTVQLKVAAVSTNQFTPHLRLVVESKPYKGISLDLEGPWVFDLTSKAIPIGNYVAGTTFRTIMPDEFSLVVPKRSVREAILYVQREARRELKTRFFESTVLSNVSRDKDDIADANHQHFLQLAAQTNRRLDAERTRKINAVKEHIEKNHKKSKDLRRRLTSIKAKRMIRRTIANSNLSQKTAEIRGIEKRIAQLKRENERKKKKIKDIKEAYEKKKQTTLDKAYEKAHTTIRQKTYIPRNKDLVIHATILLLPRRQSRR